MKHTPGPWTFDPPELGYSGALIKRGNNAIVAEAWAVDVSGSQTANARLIAAAPDLLAALDRLVRLMHNGLTDSEESDRKHAGMNYGDWREMLIRDASAAIAKATGEQP